MVPELLAELGADLAAHPELFIAISEAIHGGADKATLLKAIRDAQLAASEAVAVADLGPRPAP